MTDKDPQEIGEALLGQEEESVVPTVIYKVDVEKLRKHGYQAIADALNDMFGVLAIDLSDGGISVKMFLDTPIGKFLTIDDEKVDIL